MLRHDCVVHVFAVGVPSLCLEINPSGAELTLDRAIRKLTSELHSSDNLSLISLRVLRYVAARFKAHLQKNEYLPHPTYATRHCVSNSSFIPIRRMLRDVM